ncbi:hypothetical protein [Brevibacillus sp. MER 51]|uniref:hypothetical protein n=1 Tax=Brevibacillus sp. MER 51 TaxID=2939560 RepID=UPI002041DE33|nr:hypothetical protein [Brevibacillus sp. MER 51]MCM3144351.1 hypothetical protein [Brevibacillus sp. MER 51]
MKIIDYVTKQEIGEMEDHTFEPGGKFRIPTPIKTFYFQVMSQDSSAVFVKPLTKEEYNMATPEPIQAWVDQQTDLTQTERDELAEDLENYFVQRRKRIEQEKL